MTCITPRGAPNHTALSRRSWVFGLAVWSCGLVAFAGAKAPHEKVFRVPHLSYSERWDSLFSSVHRIAMNEGQRAHPYKPRVGHP